MSRPEYTLGFGGDWILEGVPNAGARRWFLNAVESLVPEALADLEMVAASLPLDDALSKVTTSAELAIVTAAQAKARADVAAWCDRWGFTGPDDWWRSVAHATAANLRDKDPGSPRAFTYSTSHWEPAFPELRVTWNPVREPEARFRARVEAYMDVVKAAPGLKPAPVKRLEPGDTPFRDFEWTALFQAAKWTHERIAARDRTGLAGVRAAVKRTASMIGLVLRTAPKG